MIHWDHSNLVRSFIEVLLVAHCAQSVGLGWVISNKAYNWQRCVDNRTRHHSIFHSLSSYLGFPISIFFPLHCISQVKYPIY
ncbi:hypothetical protein BY996DRAFT_7112754 [Phakopsora pachyrhizi]|nr:hypothetical protein BY996DRAFT_7112754 [Phakopsora pachyrhizi]